MFVVQRQESKREENAMKEFIAKFGDQISGVVSGFDRLVFRGHLRGISYVTGMKQYLWANQVLNKEFGAHAEKITARLKEASLAEAGKLQRPVRYLASSKTSKEDVARSIAAKDGITSGPVCVLTSVEPCWSFDIYKNRETKKLDVVKRERHCLFLYHYWMHPLFGFMNARIQSWFPFPIQICLNGREWLGRQMDGAGLSYVRRDNCFPWVEDWARAQQLMDDQLKVDWPRLLDEIAGQLNPIHDEVFAKYPLDYYWTTHQSEWASDVVFREAATLRRLQPRLMRHGMTALGSMDVMRFLGRRIPLSGEVPKRFNGEVVSNVKEREQGVRLKHFVNGNSEKLYDKAYTEVGSVLRPECTIHNVEDIRTYRPKEGDPDGPLAWRPMRRGIADLHRRAEVSQKANERYLDALASVDESSTVAELVEDLTRPVQWNGQRVRALRPLDAADSALLEAVGRGEFVVNGLRNRDLQRLLFDMAAESPQEAKRRSARVSRQLRMLRAHGIIQKVPKTHRYQLTAAGRKAITAILTARQATVAQLTAAA
jgi:hypothetical protein